jgi:hypothetical protein
VIFKGGNMKVELTKDDCFNVKSALLIAAKRPEVNEQGMTALLVLSNKFLWREENKKPIKEKAYIKRENRKS